jgi:hypothetical protein
MRYGDVRRSEQECIYSHWGKEGVGLELIADKSRRRVMVVSSDRTKYDSSKESLFWIESYQTGGVKNFRLNSREGKNKSILIDTPCEQKALDMLASEVSSFGDRLFADDEAQTVATSIKTLLSTSKKLIRFLK